MRSLLVATSLFATMALVAPQSSFAASQTVTVDTQQSGIEWLGKKLTGQHNGVVRLKNGSVTLENGVPAKGSFEIDMMSIIVSDIKDPTDNGKLVGHLKSDDFFSSSLFPTAKIDLNKFTPIANAAAGQPNYNVTGTVSIKGISQELSFPATITVANGKATAEAAMTLDRTKFNVRYGSNRFFDNLGNRVINDNFDVTVKVVGAVS